MATLVLSAVGTAIGGPLGGAVGALLGQTVDNQLFAPPRRHGPRLGDLSIQTSSYGTHIPRIYGRMRVAGTVVWATAIKEDRSVQSQGKGRPEVVNYSYSASFAVALSSRRASAIGRIWADGKLLRGEAGDFKVRTGFRFHPGGEDQELDPLIAAAEGIANTPAYRGVSLAVFEDLQLAEFGNRIPILTFELIADATDASVGTILADCTNGLVESASSAAVTGYAAHGSNMRAAITPLVDGFAVPLVDEGDAIRDADGATVVVVEDEELGCSATTAASARIERSQLPASELPAALNLNYYDRSRDYQQGSSRARSGRSGGTEVSLDLPAVVDTAKAKSLAELAIARRWAARDRLTLRLPPDYVGLQPGARISVGALAGIWTVERCEVDRLAVVAELSQWPVSPGSLPAEPGRSLPDTDVVAGPTALALFDLPQLGDEPGGLMLHLASASAEPGWRRVPIEVAVAGTVEASASAPVESTLGFAASVLPAGSADLIDTARTVDIELIDNEHWLTSCTDADLAAGANLAVLGKELIQFGIALPLGGRRFRLGRLVRGRRGSEWAMTAHEAGETFALIRPGELAPIPLPFDFVGSSVSVTAHGIGDGDGTSITVVAGGEALRPPSPVHVDARLVGGDLTVSWIRRSRNGWAWLDGVEVPIGETIERYRVSIAGTAGMVEREVDQPQILFSAAELAGLGAGAAGVSVVQVGDRAVSRPRSITLTLP